MELFTATGKMKQFFFLLLFFFLQLEMSDVRTTGNMAHIDTIFKFLPHTRQHGCIDILHCCHNACLQVSEVTWQWWDEYPVLDISPRKRSQGVYYQVPSGAKSCNCKQNSSRRLPSSSDNFCTIWMRCGFNTKRLRRTLHTVFFDIESSLAVVPLDFFGLCRKPTRTRHLQQLMGNHLISACTDTQFQSIVYTTDEWSCLQAGPLRTCTKCALHNFHRLTCVIIQHTTQLPPPGNGHFLTTYNRYAQRQKCELR